ncbi:MAG: DUF2306 domain-containing protein [Pseudomonadota bacterium]
MTILSTREWMLLLAIFLYSFVPAFGGLFRIIELAGGFALVPANPRALDAPLPILIHIAASFVFCMIGAVQFLPSVRRRSPRLHRMLGRLVATSGLISALSGLWMTHVFQFPDSLQGPLLYWIRIGVGLFMAAQILWAVASVRGGNVSAHRSAMLRAYAIGQGASTQAIFGIGWILVFSTELTGFSRDIAMGLAWALNLAIAETMIFLMRDTRNRFDYGLQRPQSDH